MAAWRASEWFGCACGSSSASVSQSSASTSPAGSYQPLVVVLGAAALGIALDRFIVSLAAPVWWTIALAGLAIWLVLHRCQRAGAASVAVLIAWLTLAGGWHHGCWNLFHRDELGLLAGRESSPVCLEAEVVSGPREITPRERDPLSTAQSGIRTRLLISALAVRDGANWRATAGRAWLTVEGQTPHVHCGDRVRVFGRLSQLAPAMNPDDFDYARHARADRQLCRLWCEHPDGVTVVDSPSVSWRRWFDGARRRADALLWKHIARERAPLASALFLGLREEMSPEDTQTYMKTGMVHILSISGLHVGLLAMGLFAVLRVMAWRPQVTACCVSALVVGYALLVEAEPPAVRATVVLLLACVATLAGRRVLAFNTLAGAALVVLAMNPADLFRAGPQLSFLCTAVLGACTIALARREADPLTRHIQQMQPWPWRALRRARSAAMTSVGTSLAIWCLAAPLVAQQFHLVSPICVLLTPVLALPATVALLSGLLLVFVGTWFPLLATPLGYCCDRSLAVVDGCVHVASELEAGHWWTAGPTLIWVVGFYAVCALAWSLPRQPARPWLRPALPTAWLGMALFVSAATPNLPAETMRVTFLSVGHGLATVVELPGGDVWLYDAGRLGSPHAAVQSVSNYLWSRRVRRIRGIVVSHLDVDHFNAVPELLERFEVDGVYLAPQPRPLDEAGQVLFAAIERAGVPHTTWSQGSTIELAPNCRATVLHPSASGVVESDNANSLVWLVEFAGRRVLLTGDLETPGLEPLLRSPAVDCDVVLAPHHGSARSDPPGFAAWSKPEFVVFSGGDGRDLQLVDAAYAEQGAERFHTARDGAVMFQINRAGVTARTWLTKRMIPSN
ncbi:MAG: ComEC/Rec2 family competence protein [Planctomycetes bacterium]|nr:ComEC/Rec2 family competence protein [Planctomycetota bacterium]